jgi:hypothetical protein
MFNFFNTGLFFIFISLTIWATPAASRDDVYLDALDAEAESSDNITPHTNKPNKSSQAANTRHQQMQEYQLLLKNSYPASYNAYNKLNQEDKETVVQNYFENGKNAAKSSHLLFNLYFESKREKRAHNESN